jgi:hypothetical protein
MEAHRGGAKEQGIAGYWTLIAAHRNVSYCMYMNEAKNAYPLALNSLLFAPRMNMTQQSPQCQVVRFLHFKPVNRAASGQ